jgi:hypothetical protein
MQQRIDVGQARLTTRSPTVPGVRVTVPSTVPPLSEACSGTTTASVGGNSPTRANCTASAIT